MNILSKNKYKYKSTQLVKLKLAYLLKIQEYNHICYQIEL